MKQKLLKYEKQKKRSVVKHVENNFTAIADHDPAVINFKSAGFRLG